MNNIGTKQFGVHVCPRFAIGYVLGRYIHEDRLQKLTSLVSAQMSESPSLAELTTLQKEIHSGINTLGFLTQINVCEYAVVCANDDIMRIVQHSACQRPLVTKGQCSLVCCVWTFGGKRKKNKPTNENNVFLGMGVVHVDELEFPSKRWKSLNIYVIYQLS